MRVLGAGIDVQLLDLLAAEHVLGQHPLDRLLDQLLGPGALEDLRRGALLDPAGVAGVPVVDLLGALVAGQRDLLGVDHDDVVAAVEARRVHGLVLAAQPQGDQRGEPPEDQAVGIDQVPAPRDVLGPGGIGLHRIGPRLTAGRQRFRRRNDSLARTGHDPSAAHS